MSIGTRQLTNNSITDVIANITDLEFLAVICDSPGPATLSGQFVTLSGTRAFDAVGGQNANPDTVNNYYSHIATVTTSAQLFRSCFPLGAYPPNAAGYSFILSGGTIRFCVLDPSESALVGGALSTFLTELTTRMQAKPTSFLRYDADPDIWRSVGRTG